MELQGSIRLAEAAPFRLGPLVVEPAVCRVVAVERREEMLEPRVMQVLVVLAEALGNVVSRDTLIERCWSGRIVGDDAVNRVIGRLRRLAEGLGGNAFRIETITKVGYRLVCDGATEALPQSMPAVSAVPEGAQPDPQPPARPDRKRALLTAFLALLVAAGIGAWLWGRDDAPASERLAVETFAPRGVRVPPAFADQLRDETVAAFGTQSRVEVALAGPAQGGLTLTGSIVPSAGGIAVLPRLLDARGEPIWSPRLDLPPGPPGVAARGVAARLAATIRCIVDGVIARPRLSQPALADWTRFCDTNDPDGDQTVQLSRLRDLTRAAPDFVAGWGSLALRLADRVQAGDAALRPEAEQVVAETLRRDPANAAAFQARAFLLPPYDHLGREALFRRATEVTPSSCGCEHHMLGYFLTGVGRWRDAVPAFARTIEMNPLSEASQVKLAQAMSAAGMTGAALARFDQLAAQSPGNPALAALRTDALLFAGRYDAVLPAFRAVPDNPSMANNIAFVTALRDRDPAAIARAADAREGLMARGSPGPMGINLLALAGRNEAALKAADGIIAAQGPMALPLLFSPALAQARATPAFAAMARKYGLVDYWRRSGQLPDFCRAADPPTLCAGLRAKAG